MGRFYKTSATPTVDYAYELPYEELFAAKKYKQERHDSALESLYEARDEFMKLDYAPNDKETVMQMRKEVDEMINNYSSSADLSGAQATINQSIADIVDRYNVADIQYTHDHWYDQMTKAQSYEVAGHDVEESYRNQPPAATIEGGRADEFAYATPVEETTITTKTKNNSGGYPDPRTLDSPLVANIITKWNEGANMGGTDLKATTGSEGGTYYDDGIHVNAGSENTIIKLSESQVPYYTLNPSTNEWDFDPNSTTVKTSVALAQGEQITALTAFKEEWGDYEENARTEADKDYEAVQKALKSFGSFVNLRNGKVYLTPHIVRALHNHGIVQGLNEVGGSYVNVEDGEKYIKALKDLKPISDADLKKKLLQNQGYKSSLIRLESLNVNPDSPKWNSLYQAHKDRLENMSDEDKERMEVEKEVTTVIGKGIEGDFRPDNSGKNTTVIYDEKEGQLYMVTKGRLYFTEKSANNAFVNSEYDADNWWWQENWKEAFVDGDVAKIINEEYALKGQGEDKEDKVINMYSVPMWKKYAITPDAIDRYDDNAGDFKTGELNASREHRMNMYTMAIDAHIIRQLAENEYNARATDKLFRANTHQGLLSGETLSADEKESYAENIFTNIDNGGLLDKVNSLPDSKIKNSALKYINEIKDELHEAMESGDETDMREISKDIAYFENMLSRELFGGEPVSERVMIDKLRTFVTYMDQIDVGSNGNAQVNGEYFLKDGKVVNENLLIDYTRNEAENKGLVSVNLGEFSNLNASNTEPIYGPYISSNGLEKLRRLDSDMARKKYKLDITGLFRADVYNSSISHHSSGMHTHGNAVDIGIGGDAIAFFYDYTKNPGKYPYIANIIDGTDHFHIAFN